MIRILNMGSMNIDYVYAVPHFVQAGETLASTARQIFPGGKGLNQSIALARAGTSVFHAGKIGREGQYLVEAMRDAGVDTSMIEQCSAPTGHTVIQVNPKGENCILLFPGANMELDEAFADKALSSFTKGDILVLQNEVSSIAYAMKKAKAKGMRVAINLSPFGAEIEKYPLELADWFLLNEIEGQALTGESKPTNILNVMVERYPDTITVLTLGEEGVLCYTGGKVLHHRSYKVQIVDTTAAGDTFTGYFIGAIAKGESIKEALRLASIGASISVSRKGASVSIPHRNEVLQPLYES